MSGKFIHNLKRKREEECSSNSSSKTSSPAGSPLTINSQTSIIVNPSCSSLSATSSSSSSSSSIISPSYCLIKGNSTNSLSTQSINSYSYSEYKNKPGTSSITLPSSSIALPSSLSSTAIQSSVIITQPSSSSYDTNTTPNTNNIEQLKIIAQDAKREKHDFYVDTPESSNDGTERLLPLTPPSESDDSQNGQEQPQILPKTTRNIFLVEALKRIVELQNELEELDQQQQQQQEQQCGGGEEELEDHEVSNIINQPSLSNRSEGIYQYQYQQEQPQIHNENFNAEALGFAMCARETLLFLQQEGIPENSEIYKALREKLVGKSQQEIPI